LKDLTDLVNETRILDASDDDEYGGCTQQKG
jgi:hypothetical protein